MLGSDKMHKVNAQIWEHSHILIIDTAALTKIDCLTDFFFLKDGFWPIKVWLVIFLIVLLWSGCKEAISLWLWYSFAMHLSLAFMLEAGVVDGAASCVSRCSCDVW